MTKMLSVAGVLVVTMHLSTLIGLGQDMVRIEDMTWEEVAAAIRAGKTTAIYYAGGAEQNGPHMAFGKHIIIADRLGERIARELGNALVLPVMPYAPSGDPTKRTGMMAFPGTTSVTDEAFAMVARDVAESAITAGFKDVVVMGDHGGGQESLRAIASQLTDKYKDSGIRVHYCRDVYERSGEEFNKYLLQRGISAQQARHAGARDTAEILYLKPEWIRQEKIKDASVENGVFGDPRVATAELGKVYLDTKVRLAVEEIRRLIGTTPVPR